MPAQFPIIFVVAAIVLIAIAKGGKKDKKARTELAPLVPMQLEV